MTIREQDVLRHALDLYRYEIAEGNFRVSATNPRGNEAEIERRTINELELRLCGAGPIKGAKQ